MNTDNLVQMMQKGLHVTLGAASFLVETATTPDSQQRDDNLTKLQTGDFNRLSEEWAVTGEQKEQEARTFVETLIPNDFMGMQSDATRSTSGQSGQHGPSVPADIQNDLEVLMSTLGDIRAGLKD
ncbi:MAG: hypothetical protein F6K30_23200 [Cyanothece sp. SIO2G6]|nr:hypothetical protein [Cyanothece sp. SIO2G6]